MLARTRDHLFDTGDAIVPVQNSIDLERSFRQRWQYQQVGKGGKVFTGQSRLDIHICGGSQVLGGDIGIKPKRPELTADPAADTTAAGRDVDAGVEGTFSDRRRPHGPRDLHDIGAFEDQIEPWSHGPCERVDASLAAKSGLPQRTAQVIGNGTAIQRAGYLAQAAGERERQIPKAAVAVNDRPVVGRPASGDRVHLKHHRALPTGQAHSQLPTLQ